MSIEFVLLAARKQELVVILTGVSGSGKSTVGRILAHELGWTFVEGDDFHPPQNVRKMKAGIPLEDEDRRPWLLALQREISRIVTRGSSAIVACSALKKAYRDTLRRDEVTFVYLKAEYAVIRARLAHRRGHFFPERLLDSQFRSLEEPRNALVVEAEQAPERVARAIIRKLALNRPAAER